MFGEKEYAPDRQAMAEDGSESKYGKKFVVQNCGMYMNKERNAGVVCNRITELNLNSRKKISNVKGDSSQMKDILNHIDHKILEVVPAKRPLISYSSYDNQQKYFETKLVPDTQGKMSICVGRKSGSATVHINIDEYDLEKTYHTWKKIMGKSAPHNKSNLENDRFLTVSENAERSDKLPIIKNRNPPFANPDGPFEKQRLNLPKQARDNLDRTLTPLATSEKNVVLKKKKNTHKDSFILLRPHDEIIPDEIKGVRRSNFPWINSNRIKKILNYNYVDDTQEKSEMQMTPQNSLASKKENYTVQADVQAGDQTGDQTEWMSHSQGDAKGSLDPQDPHSCNIPHRGTYTTGNIPNGFNFCNVEGMSPCNDAKLHEQQYGNFESYERARNYIPEGNYSPVKKYANAGNTNNEKSYERGSGAHGQGAADGQNFNAQNKQKTSQFGTYNECGNDTNCHFQNETCYNGQSDDRNGNNKNCISCHEHANGAAYTSSGKTNEQGTFFRAPSLTEIP
ncbi:thioredoxin-like associated protein 1, putative (TLAP1) [Plasmodium ovale curtisi]|uniref:Thioredoxin-like associated protein 1, putative (TLAP1) n=1 Tax=Plasmodium ovale curtisi TaxID=864141 RepID=A0A1A8W9M3_PLAOA|nr:thioredoxin-like associated protein 1, putative (TLAP1) [Plasmodium ovale curtisi]SBS98435.1 thioredoxin-like associated protein 1, putative (TLAP1) [Plasmodium ovale curtisi]